MGRRLRWALVGAVLGYAVAVVLSFTVFTLAHGSRSATYGLRSERDGWALRGGVAGVLVGATVGVVWSGGPASRGRGRGGDGPGPDDGGGEGYDPPDASR